MSTVDQKDTEREVNWPLRLTGRELAELVDSLGLQLAASSPLAQVDLGRSRAVIGLDANGGQQPAAVARAVRVTCNPRQLLLVRLGAIGGDATEPQVLGFLNDGDLLVRFDVGASGCILAEPCTHGEFAQVVCSLAGIQAQTSNNDGILIAQGFLEVIVGLRSAGLFDAPEARISLSDAEVVTVAAAGDESRAGERLRALEADGVLVIEGSTVLASSEWSSACPFLCVPAGMTVEAIELADLAAGRTRRKRLAILGETPERVVSLPAAVDGRVREVILGLEAATTENVGSAVEQLLAPPLSPPCEPIAECMRSQAGWLRGTVDRGELPDWYLQAFEDIVAPLDEVVPIPDALLTPQATIEIASMARGGVGLQRSILALDDTNAVEWTLEGSFIRWRALGPGQVMTRILELTHVGATGAAGLLPCELPSDALEALMAGPSALHALASLALPAPLKALAGDARTRWHTIYATCQVRGTNQEHTILLAYSDASGTFRFDLDGDVLTARTVDLVEIHSELVSALTAPTTPVVSANNSTHIS